MDTDATGGTLQPDEIRFMQLVSMFQMAAMQQLGKLANPMTNEIERNLDQASASIDLLEMLKRRTEGNRTPTENEFLDKVLFELHMNYVDEVKAAREEESKDGDGETSETAGDPPGDAEPEK